MLARWGLRTAMDAGWGLQLQLQAWPVPNRRIQPRHAELDPENPSRPPDRHWPNCKRGGGEPSRVRAWVLASKERPGAAHLHVRGGWERLLRAATCGALVAPPPPTSPRPRRWGLPQPLADEFVGTESAPHPTYMVFPGPHGPGDVAGAVWGGSGGGRN